LCHYRDKAAPCVAATTAASSSAKFVMKRMCKVWVQKVVSSNYLLPECKGAVVVISGILYTVTAPCSRTPHYTCLLTWGGGGYNAAQHLETLFYSSQSVFNAFCKNGIRLKIVRTSWHLMACLTKGDVKVKSLCLTKHHATKTCGRVEV